MIPVPRARLVLAAIVTAGATLSADIKFQSTYKSVDAASTSFAGKKVAALVISDDDGLRVPGEEALARELTARGMQGVATYRIAPKEELRDPERAKAWFERSKVEGVVALRPVSSEKRNTYSSVMWTTGVYNSFWGYYGYGWTEIYVPLTVGRETVVVVENTIYSVPKNALLWAAVAETTDPKNLQKFVGELVTAIVKEMQNQGLAKGKGQ